MTPRRTDDPFRATDAASLENAEPSNVSLLPVRRDHDDPPDEPDDPRLSDVDEWGRSEHMRQLARARLRPHLPKWFRAEWEGLEKIPTDGGALLVANHAGGHPDRRAGDHARHRDRARPPGATGWPTTSSRRCPVVGTSGPRSAAWSPTPTTPTGCSASSSSSCWSSPRARKGPGKPYSERYRLRRFGRGGFVEIAMRAGVPVVPIAVVGAEESMPIVWKSQRRWPSALGCPTSPSPPTRSLFGPVLGTVAYFPAKFKLQVLDPVHFDVRARPGALLEEPHHGRVRAHPRPDPGRRSTRCCATAQSVWFG